MNVSEYHCVNKVLTYSRHPPVLYSSLIPDSSLLLVCLLSGDAVHAGKTAPGASRNDDYVPSVTSAGC